MSDYKVSVIITVFNRIDFLHETINSVLRQGFKPFEVIIVDDGSTNLEVSKFLERFKSDLCRVVRIENLGPAGARNYGRSLASGDYLIFLDDDDLLLESYIFDNLENIIKNDVDVSYSLASLLTARGDELPWGLPPFDKRRILLDNCVYISAMMKSKCFDAVGGFDESFVNGHEDHDFWVRVASKNFKFGRVEKPGFIYRQSQGGVNGKYAVSVDAMVAVNSAISRNSPNFYIENIDVLWREIIEQRMEIRRYKRVYGRVDAVRRWAGEKSRIIKKIISN